MNIENNIKVYFDSFFSINRKVGSTTNFNRKRQTSEITPLKKNVKFYAELRFTFNPFSVVFRVVSGYGQMKSINR